MFVLVTPCPIMMMMMTVIGLLYSMNVREKGDDFDADLRMCSSIFGCFVLRWVCEVMT